MIHPLKIIESYVGYYDGDFTIVFLTANGKYFVQVQKLKDQYYDCYVTELKEINAVEAETFINKAMQEI